MCKLQEFHTQDTPCPFCNKLTVSDFDWTNEDDEVFQLLDIEFVMDDYHEYMRLHPDIKVGITETTGVTAQGYFIYVQNERVDNVNPCWPLIVSTFGDNDTPIIIDGWNRLAKLQRAGIFEAPYVFIPAKEIELMRETT